MKNLNILYYLILSFLVACTNTFEPGSREHIREIAGKINDPELEKAETWTGEWWKYGGGDTVWDAMAYDPDLNLLYIETGNGSPTNRE